MPAGSAYRRIYAAVARIPKGRVATYGQIARLAGLPRHARQVGYALGALPDSSRLPWQRVVNAQGAVSRRAAETGAEDRQETLLRREGVRLKNGRISLRRYQWNPEK